MLSALAQAAALSEDFAGLKTTSFLVIFAFFSSSAGVTRRYSVLDAMLDISEDFFGGSTAFLKTAENVETGTAFSLPFEFVVVVGSAF